MAGRLPEHRVRVPFMRQSWREVVFLHWPYPPAEIARLLPPGFEVHTYDGTAWVGLTPFVVDACGVGPFPPLTTWSFPETNLRTYVTGPDGTDGIWFLSLEAASRAVTWGARTALGTPYHHATMDVRPDRARGRIHYTSHRHADIGVGHDILVEIGPETPETEREGLVDWCTGRWRSWTHHAGLRISAPVEHQPWPLHHAEVLRLEETISAAGGLPPPEGPPLAHYAPGVDARFALPRPRRPGGRAARG